MKIEWVITDVDGCLTDGGVYVLDNGTSFRRFNTFDGHGGQLLRNAGIQLAVVTTSKSLSIQARAEWLEAKYYVYKDKAQFVRDFAFYRTDVFNKVAYFGNDLPDMPVLLVSAYVGCPYDAHPKVLDYVRSRQGFRAYRKGGDGAFREFADWVIATNLHYTV